jgi:toxin ParE1/3/4
VADFRLSGNAAAELDEILDWSEITFGPEARERYAALAFQAMQNVADEPRQPNVHWIRISKREIGVYHIGHSRDRVPAGLGRVGQPRHYLVFGIGADAVIDILGFVHDGMLLTRAFRRLAKKS